MEEFAQIPLTDITPNPLNPRKRFDGPEFDELVASIIAKGVIAPIVVHPFDGPTPYEIVAGERRYRASLKAAEANGGAAATIPAMIRELSDEDVLEIMIIENAHSRDLTELEEANGFKTYILRIGEGAVQRLSERTGINPQYIRRRVAILDLPKKALAAWEKGELKYGHLEQLSRLNNRKEICEWVDEILHMRGAYSVAELKRRLAENFPLLKTALFDTEYAGCPQCQQNSDVQKSLFGLDDGDATKCLGPTCFKRHQNDWLTANWKKRGKKYGTNGFRFAPDVAWADVNYFYKPAVLCEKCKECSKLVTLVNLDGSKRSDRVCIGQKACFAAVQAESSKSSQGNGQQAGIRKKTFALDAPRVAWHGQHFREVFYKTQLPLRFQEIPPQEPRALHVALLAMLDSNPDQHAWFARRYNLATQEELDKSWYRADPGKIMEAIIPMTDTQTLQELRDLSMEIILQRSGPQVRHLAASHIGIELEKEWIINAEYLEKKTLAEMHQIAEIHGIFKDPKAQAFLFETLLKKRGNFKSCKKPELIRIFLESGVDLAGKVPAEILRGTETEVSES
jgi:ParB/RepB/Spo0J family partition protein